VELVAERAHCPAPAAAVKRGTENESTDMTDAVAKPLNLSLPRRNRARRVPVVLAMKQPGRQLPAVSVHVPVTPENRSRLRLLREVEMAAWSATTEAGFDTGHFERRQAVEKERRDLRAFGLIALMAVATVMVGLLKSSAFVEEWAGLVKYVRQLIG
jgi:hypothetical protein